MNRRLAHCPRKHVDTSCRRNANNSVETYNLTDDDNGNLVEKRGQGAAASKTTTFSWDKQNQLNGLISGASQTSTDNITASFSYDQFGRRVNKNITANGQSSNVNYVYDGDQAVGEQANGTTTSQLTGIAIDEHIARYSGQDQHIYLTDALGSIIAQTKPDGTVQNKYGYTPYGQVAKDGDDKGNPHQYTGRENDNTGLLFYRARYYMPSCGRFISEDPIGLRGGANFYAYVNGDPVNLVDPTGEFGLPGALGAFGFELAMQVGLNRLCGRDFYDIDVGDLAAATVAGLVVPPGFKQLMRLKRALGPLPSLKAQREIARTANRRQKLDSKIERYTDEVFDATTNLAYGYVVKRSFKEAVPESSPPRRCD